MAASHQQQMNDEKLYEIVAHIKDMIHQDKQQAREILIENPDLCRTLFKAQIMLGMVKPFEAAGPNLETVYSNSTGTSGLADREASFGQVMPGKTTGETHIPGTQIITPVQMAAINDSPLSPGGTFLGTDCSNLSFGKKEMPAVHREGDAPLEPDMTGITSWNQILGRPTTGSDQIAQNIDRRLTPLTAEIEQDLLHELKNLTPEQINLLPDALRQPVIQLQEVHRQWEHNFL